MARHYVDDFLYKYVKERLNLTFYTTSSEEGCPEGRVVGKARNTDESYQ